MLLIGTAIFAGHMFNQQGETTEGSLKQWREPGKITQLVIDGVHRVMLHSHYTGQPVLAGILS